MSKQQCKTKGKLDGCLCLKIINSNLCTETIALNQQSTNNIEITKSIKKIEGKNSMEMTQWIKS